MGSLVFTSQARAGFLSLQQRCSKKKIECRQKDLELVLPCEHLSSSTQACPKRTPHYCRAGYFARCPLHPYCQGPGIRRMKTLSGIRRDVGTATSCLDFSLT